MGINRISFFVLILVNDEECFGKCFYKRILLLLIKQVKGQYCLAVLSTLGGATIFVSDQVKLTNRSNDGSLDQSLANNIVQSKVFQAVNLKILYWRSRESG
jgi:hypothetical protein